MVPLQQHYRRLARSAALILGCLLLPHPVGAALCAEPGRDGAMLSGSTINGYFSGPDNQALPPGTRTLTLSHSRGRAVLQPGDLALLMQVQGAPINTSNSQAYGQIRTDAPAPWAQEWVRIERVDADQVRILGAGPGGGLLHHYDNAPANEEQGRRRWQLVRVPQFDSLSLEQDVAALPWNGTTGGVLAVDVRRQLDLNGHTLSVRGTGFRGAPAVSLQGALGRPDDWRYSTPSVDDQAAGYGHHGSKGEGLAGTPLLLLPAATLGYPQGDMARGAPANAGGGGNGLDLAHQQLGNGGGGGNGGAGEQGAPEQGGGEGGHPAVAGWILGGGGGAAARRNGEGGNGGSGGGLLVIRTARLVGDGLLDLRGLPGRAITGTGRAEAIGGGGGAGGTLWLDASTATTVSASIEQTGGAGGGAGGAGGAGQPLAARDGIMPALRPLPVSGVAAGYRCRPAGHWITGQLFEDNGAGEPALAFNGQPDPGERRLTGWAVSLAGAGNEPGRISTVEGGHFQFRLSEARSQGQPMALTLALPEHWHVPQLPGLNGQAGEHVGETLRWGLRALPDQHSGPLLLGLVSEPLWRGPDNQHLETGSTAVLRFEYRASLSGQVQFASAHPAVRSLLMDRHCSGNSEQWQSGKSPAWPVTAGERVCVRVPILFQGKGTAISVTATTVAAGAPDGFSLPPQTVTVKILPAP